MIQSGVWIERLARWTAVLGGVVLIVVGVLTVISITGRGLLFAGLKPIPGDFELVEAGTAFVVCAFMPWAQLQRGHASVAILTDRFPPVVNRLIDLLADAFLFAAAIIVTWRHFYGLLDKLAYQETTFILRFPIWWSYAGALVGMIVWVIVAAWCTANSVVALSSPQAAAPRHAEEVH